MASLNVLDLKGKEIEKIDISEDIIGISMKIKGEKIVFFKLYLRRKFIKDLASFYENFKFMVKSKNI